jgi:hypothetical protein
MSCPDYASERAIRDTGGCWVDAKKGFRCGG